MDCGKLRPCEDVQFQLWHLEDRMKVLLRNLRTGFYYRGDCAWTSERKQALDLVQTETALRLAAQLRLEAAEVVLAFADPHDDLTLPCGGPWWKN